MFKTTNVFSREKGTFIYFEREERKQDLKKTSHRRRNLQNECRS
jgi:hypothetical protein